MARGRINYSDDTIEETIALYSRVGLMATVRQTGISKTTILTWAKQRGVSPEGVTEDVLESKRLAGLRSAQERNERLAAGLGERIDGLLRLSALAITRETQILAAGGLTKAELQAVTGARSKAIHDLQLLAGYATERTDSQNATIEAVKLAFAQSLLDAGLTDDQMEAVRAAFAHRIRLAVSGEAPTYAPAAEVPVPALEEA